MIALMALSSTFVSCSDSDDDTDNAEQAKAIAGTYKGYSIGESKMFSDYLMGADASATIIANSDGTINLVYNLSKVKVKLLWPWVETLRVTTNIHWKVVSAMQRY